jgi:hypothetical protein
LNLQRADYDSAALLLSYAGMVHRNSKEPLRPFLLTLAAQQDDPAIGQPGHNAKGAYEVQSADVLRAGRW